MLFLCVSDKTCATASRPHQVSVYIPEIGTPEVVGLEMDGRNLQRITEKHKRPLDLDSIELPNRHMNREIIGGCNVYITDYQRIRVSPTRAMVSTFTR